MNAIPPPPNLIKIVTGSRRRKILFGIILVAVLLRLVFSLGIARGLLHIQPELESTDGYHDIARSLFEGHGYRFEADGPLATERAPAYPAFLLAVFSIDGINYVFVQIAQAILGGLTCWLFFLFGRWVLSVELGLAAAALYAIYPNSIEYSARLYVENIYFPIFIGFTYLLSRASLGGSMGRGAAAGAVWGISLLTRGTLLPLPFILPFGIAISPIHRSNFKWLRWTLPAAATGLLIISPWTIRNYVVTGTFVPVSTWAWPPIYHGTQVAKRMGEWTDLMSVDIAATIHVRDLFNQQSTSENASSAADHYAIRYDNFAKQLTLSDWKNDPAGLVERSLRGLGYAWFFTFGAKMRALSLVTHLPLLILFIVGATRMRRSYPKAFKRAWPALGIILFVNAFYAIAYPHVRYMSPAIALSFLFSGLSLILLYQKFVACISRRRRKTLISEDV